MPAMLEIATDDDSGEILVVDTYSGQTMARVAAAEALPEALAQALTDLSRIRWEYDRWREEMWNQGRREMEEMEGW